MKCIPVTGRHGSRICAALLLVALSSSVYTVVWPRNLNYAQLDVKVHEQVLEGTAEAPYQYQMYLHERILERLWDAMPRRNAAGFAEAATLYYGVGELDKSGDFSPLEPDHRLPNEYAKCVRYREDDLVGIGTP